MFETSHPTSHTSPQLQMSLHDLKAAGTVFPHFLAFHGTFALHLPYSVCFAGGKADARSNRASLRSETHQCTEHHSLQFHACFSSGMPSSNLGNTTLTHISVACNLKISQNIAFFSKNVFFILFETVGTNRHERRATSLQSSPDIHRQRLTHF